MKLYLPDATKGYYQGTRFDWSGVIPSLEYKGHQYFGQWFEKYNAKTHDAVQGPAEEFRTEGETSLGYAEAKAGGTFVRVGVGTVRKPDERAYQLFHTYEIVDHGQWTVKAGKDRVEFTQILDSGTGYAYEYRKTVRLAAGEPRMVIEHSLKNTGKKAISTAQYNHNFFVIDKQVTGPDVSVRFPFVAKATADLHGMARIGGKEVEYLRALEAGESTMTGVEGFGGTAVDYDLRIENKKSGAGVRIRGDRPLSKVLFWSIRSTACPEPYIQLDVAPGAETKWTITYDFYTVEDGL